MKQWTTSYTTVTWRSKVTVLHSEILKNLTGIINQDRNQGAASPAA